MVGDFHAAAAEARFAPAGATPRPYPSVTFMSIPLNAPRGSASERSVSTVKLILATVAGVPRGLPLTG